MLTSTSFGCNINVSISKTSLLKGIMTFNLRGGRITVFYGSVIQRIMKKIIRTTDIITIFKLFVPVIMMWMASCVEKLV